MSQQDRLKYAVSQQVNSVQLAPSARPIALFEPFIAKKTETLILREKVFSLSGDSFDICLANGQPLVKVEGRVMSLSGRKSITDLSGKPLFDIVKEHFHIHSTYVLEDKQKKKLLELKSSFKLFGSKATATFTSNDGKSHSLVMSGNWLDTSADIVDESTNTVVGRIDRKLVNAREFFGSQTYALVVAPGVDMVLMAALCICLDEKNNE